MSAACPSSNSGVVNRPSRDRRHSKVPQAEMVGQSTSQESKPKMKLRQESQ
jgi:hypothetical protein